ncbi:hypothetical protein [Serratia sp. 1D1416]|uniref:hypothetical protein n=1 Tax=Serratia sp. 1D1416 TaxID=2447890 RepID=UPI001013CFDF|nr:hypothetical protein [Serratia sp. 1D1416]
MTFENWTIDELFERYIDIDDGSLEMDSEGFTALRRKIAELRSTQPVSQGYKLVPVELTKEMIVAGQDEFEECVDRGFSSDADGNRYDYTDIAPDAPARIFKAMMAAAPEGGK